MGNFHQFSKFCTLRASRVHRKVEFGLFGRPPGSSAEDATSGVPPPALSSPLFAKTEHPLRSPEVHLGTTFPRSTPHLGLRASTIDLTSETDKPLSGSCNGWSHSEAFALECEDVCALSSLLHVSALDLVASSLWVSSVPVEQLRHPLQRSLTRIFEPLCGLRKWL